MKRRNFINKTITGTTGIILVPMIVPSTVFGKSAPSNRIHIGQIGCGRIAREHDMFETFKYKDAIFVALCDVDSKRTGETKQMIEQWYSERTGRRKYNKIKIFNDYREMLNDGDIDGVIISTPDHWHARIAIDAALSGKDIYLQKPASLTIAEGRQMSDVLKKTGRILQMGSQQRSVNPWPQFKRVCELVRNGRVGELLEIYIGLPGDPSGDEEPEMLIPPNLNYNFWLGSTPVVYYTEKRVHPREGYDRPGWLRCEQFGAGMITGWGAHHLDTAHWAMGTELTGPLEIEGSAEFPRSGLWDVHGDFNVIAKYANGVKMHVSGEYPNGVKFIGTDGWIFAARSDAMVTSSDPGANGETVKSLDASDLKILESEIGKDEIHLQYSEEQHRDWLDSIKSRKQPVAPAEVGHRSCSACLISHIAMKLGRKLYWDPEKERFKNDDEANAMLSRPQRTPYGTDYVV
jgi:myo-inositol 2-dehydrogenase/D-chiro-inositol 1-dehydrogenase